MHKLIKTRPFLLTLIPIVLMIIACNLLSSGTPTAVLPSAATGTSTSSVILTGTPAITPILATPTLSEEYKPWNGVLYPVNDWEEKFIEEDDPIVQDLVHIDRGQALINRRIDGCIISLESGHGMSPDWTISDEYLEAGDAKIEKRIFTETATSRSFIVYGFKFLVNFPLDEKDQCIQIVEQVIITFRP